MGKKKYLIMGITSSNWEISASIVDFAVLSLNGNTEWKIPLSWSWDQKYNLGVLEIESIDFNADHHEINFYSCYGKDINGINYEFDDIDVQISKEEFFITEDWPRVDEMIRKDIPIQIMPAEVEGVRLTVHKEGSFNWSANMRKTAEPVTLETIPMKYEDLLNLLRESKNGNNTPEG